MAGVQLSVQVRGELVRKGLQNLEAQVPQIGRQQIRTVMDRIKRRMQEYPPEPAGQSIASQHPVLGKIYRTAKGRYQRTGLLGASWSIDSTDNGYMISNSASRKGRFYAKYVVGNAYGLAQAWMHVGRWQLLRDVTDQEVANLPKEINQQIAMVARRAGFSNG